MNEKRVQWLMPEYRVTVLPGDGTGKEVIREARKVMDVFEDLSPLSFKITEIPCGGEYYLETGLEWPEGSFEHCRDCLLYTSPSPRDRTRSRMPSSA